MRHGQQGRITARGVARTIGVATAVLASGACRKGGSDAKAEGAPAATTVEVGAENVAVVGTSRIEAGPAISGSLEAERQASIRAQIGGTVLAVPVEQGQTVAAGTVLARLDDSAVRDSYLSARSAVTSAQASADVARRELERSEKLLAGGAIAERDLESTRRANVGATAALADARARLALADKQLAYTRVTAPFSGVVATRTVSLGSVVSIGNEMFTIVAPGSMRLQANVPAEQLGDVRVGMPVRFTVNGYGDRRFEGRITRVSPVADPTTRQVPIIASIPNAGSTLVGGLFAEGRIATETHDGIVVPQTAVDQRGLAPMVTRLKGGRAERVQVALGIQDTQAETYEVTSGLASGDTVLIGAAQGINAGTPVRVTTVRDASRQVERQ